MPVVITSDPTPSMERPGLIPTRRGPVSRFSSWNPVDDDPMAPPLPNPAALQPALKPASPDAGAATPWPPATG